MSRPPIRPRLAELRKSRGMTVGQVADAMGVTHTRIWHIETGQNDVRISSIERYLAACNAHLEIVSDD